MIWYFQTWETSMNHNSIAVTRSLYGSRRYAFSFDRSPSELSEEEEGEKKIEDEIDTPKPDLFRKPCKQHFRFVLFSASSPLFREKSTPLERTRARFRRDTSDRDDSESAIVGSKVSRLCPRHNKHHHGDHVARESSVRGRRRAWSLAVTSRTEPRARHRVRK